MTPIHYLSKIPQIIKFEISLQNYLWNYQKLS